MFKNYCILTLLVLLAFSSEAGNIIFSIKDKNTQQPVVSCKITVGIDTRLTDSSGKVIFTDIKLPAEIICHCIGYEDNRKTFYQLDKTNYVLYLNPSVNELKQVVITGQPKPMLATQSVYKVNTINSQQIMQRGAVSLNDVLNFENNNFISNDNILGSSVSIGGISGQNIKILVNGIAMTGRENGNIDLGQVNLQNIKRIEMIQGPMSVVYGSNAMGGVINLITNTPQKPLSISVRSYLESIGKYNFSTNIGYTKKQHQLQYTLARNFFQGWTPTDSLDRFQLWKPKTQYVSDLYYNYTVNKNFSIQYFGSYLNEKITNKGTPIISPYEGYAFDEYYRTQRLINSLSAKYDLNKHSSINLMNSYTFYNRKKNRYKKDLVTLEQFPTTSSGDQDSSTFNTIHLRGVYANSSIKHTDFSLGYEFTRETAISSKLSENLKPINDLGIFASLLYTYKQWSLQPSARFTFNNFFDKAFTPAVHLKYEINSSTQVRASFARGFRTPSLKEMYLQFIDQNHTIIGNEDLKPETGNRYELSINNNTSIKKVNVQTGLSLACNDLQNMITLAVFNGHSVLRQYMNLENYRNYLFNFTNALQYKKVLMKQGFGFIYVPGNGYIPMHTIYEYSNVLSYNISPIKTTINFNYKFNSKQPVLSTDNRYLFTQAVHIANASAQRYFINKSLLVQLGLKNLFNIQNTTLTGVSDIQGNAHTNASGMYLFPERSVFVDINYIF